MATASAFSGRTIASGKDLTELDFATLNQVNGYVVFNSVNGSFTFSPTPDGAYVPDFAEASLQKGHFDSSPQLMIGHNSNEAALFVPPTVDTEEELIASLQPVFKTFRPDAVEYLLNDLYPPPGEDTPYSTQNERALLLVAESSFACNTRFLAVAFGNETMNYRFQVPPGFHGQDLSWTFHHENQTLLNNALAESMQTYFTTFAKSGYGGLEDTDLDNIINWPMYGENAQLVTFGLEGLGTAEDDTKNSRCSFWQQGEHRRS